MRVNSKVTLLAAGEFVLAVVAVHAAAFVRFAGDLPAETEGSVLWLRSLIFGAVVVVSMTAIGLYQIRQRLKIEGVAVRVALGLGLAAVGLAVIYFAVPILRLWRGWWVLSFVLTLLLFMCSRIAFAKAVDQSAFRRRVVVYGAGKRASALLELRRRSDQRGFQLLAFLPVPNEPLLVQDARVDYSTTNVLEFVHKHSAEEVVIAMDDRRRNFPIRELLDCKFEGIDVVDIFAFLERESGKVRIDLLAPSLMIFSDGFTQRPSRMIALRLFDLAVSITVLLMGWPLMLLTALAILLQDGRPVLYRQTRVGLLGKPFELLKFRSMTKNAEIAGEARWAQKNDTRVTRVGALIRKLRFDELPQLFNVINGDMRFVGPRPERPEFVKELAEKIPVLPRATLRQARSHGLGAAVLPLRVVRE